MAEDLHRHSHPVDGAGRPKRHRSDRNQPVDYGPLPDLLGYRIRRAQLSVFQNFAARLADARITPGQLGLLILIDHNRGISQTRLARAVGIERSTLGEVIGRLDARGLITRKPSKEDRRSYALNLSAEGKVFLDKLMPRIRDHEKAMLAPLDADERRELIRLLGKLADR